jgi:type III restriction enzyme
MRTKWVPGVNNLGNWGRWEFAEFGDVYEMDKQFSELIERIAGAREAA